MTQQQPDIAKIMHMEAMMIPFIALFWVIKVALYVVPMWRIAKRSGQNPPIALLAAIPLIGRMITLYILAFSDWRVQPVNELPYGYAPMPLQPVFTPQPPAPASYPPAPYPPAPMAASPETPRTPDPTEPTGV